MNDGAQKQSSRASRTRILITGLLALATLLILYVAAGLPAKNSAKPHAAVPCEVQP